MLFEQVTIYYVLSYLPVTSMRFNSDMSSLSDDVLRNATVFALPLILILPGSRANADDVWMNTRSKRQAIAVDDA